MRYRECCGHGVRQREWVFCRSSVSLPLRCHALGEACVTFGLGHGQKREPCRIRRNRETGGGKNTQDDRMVCCLSQKKCASVRLVRKGAPARGGEDSSKDVYESSRSSLSVVTSISLLMSSSSRSSSGEITSSSSSPAVSRSTSFSCSF